MTPAEDDRAEIVGYCLRKPGAWQDEPWEGDQVAKTDSRDGR